VAVPAGGAPVAEPGGRAQVVDAAGQVGQASAMSRAFSVAQARELMPDVLSHGDDLIEVRASLVELQAALAAGERSPLGGLPEAKAFQAQLSELLGWFPDHGLDLKGFAPLLLDFPSELAGEPVLLCWLEGERELGWYHKLAFGFAGRRRIPAGC
jgi:hypothetical protein